MFGGSSNSGWFFESAMHVEAMSRLMYLAESREALGWLTGPDGSGRTHVLSRLKTELEAASFAVTLLNVSGMDQSIALASLADAAGFADASGATPAGVMRGLADELRGRGSCNLHTVVMLDDVHRAVDEGHGLIRILLALRARCGNRLTVFAASNSVAPADIADDALVRIGLTLLDATESEAFVVAFARQHRLPILTADSSIAQTISECAAGSPARIARLCRLLKVVSEASPDVELTQNTVLAIQRDLLPRAA